jgi:bla regulator protein BlaR1
MVIWVLYVIAVSALVGAAAFCAERSAQLRRAPTRWYWLVAIVASLLLPAIIASVSVQVPNLVGVSSPKAVVLRNVTSIPLSPRQWIVASNARVVQWRSFDNILKTAWALSSGGMLVILIGHAGLLRRRARQWRQARLMGRKVMVSQDVGPAVVGFLRPRIVIPSWVERASRPTRMAVIAHEYGHLEAHDPQLLTVALFLLVAIPWNLPLWWQLRRLRHAIEVDCDARVIGNGHDAVSYSESLISVGERQSAYIGAVAAMAESASRLEQRIQIIMGKRARFWKISAAALLSMSLVFVGAAAQVSPPNAQSSAPPAAINLDAATLQRYVGHYRMGADAVQGVMTVTLSGTQLATQMTGQMSVNVYPQTPTHFFLKVVPAELDFVADGSGPATALILHQAGRDVTMPRMDDAQAVQFNAAFAARVQSNTPRPGAEAAVQEVLGRMAKGQTLDYSKLSPEFAAVVKDQEQMISAGVASLGALQTVTFQSVLPQGADSFRVKFAGGSLLVSIVLDSKGIITGMGLQPAP